MSTAKKNKEKRQSTQFVKQDSSLLLWYYFSCLVRLEPIVFGACHLVIILMKVITHNVPKFLYYLNVGRENDMVKGVCIQLVTIVRTTTVLCQKHNSRLRHWSWEQYGHNCQYFPKPMKVLLNNFIPPPRFHLVIPEISNIILESVCMKWRNHEISNDKEKENCWWICKLFYVVLKILGSDLDCNVTIDEELWRVTLKQR